MRRRDLLFFGGAFLLSALGHVTLFYGLSSAARNNPRQRARVIEMAVKVREPPPPAKAPEPPRAKPPPPPKLDVAKVMPVLDLPPPPNTAASEQPAAKAKPVFGISMSSVVGPGSGSFSVRVGNTLMKAPEEEYTAPSEVKAYKVVPAHKLSRAPRTRNGPCQPRGYAPEAKELGIEGQVKVRVVIMPSGKTADTQILSGLGHGLDELALEVVKNCEFEPGTIDGEPVATTITYTVTFVVEE